MNLFILSAFRRIFKNKVSTVINLVGLTLSIITFLLIISWIKSEQSYDRFWPGYNEMFRVTLTQTSNGSPVLSTAMNYSGAGPVLRNELPEIEAATILNKDKVTVFTPEKSFQDINLFYLDTSFFKVFPRPLQADNSNIYADIHGAILSRSMAKKLFGNTNPLNQRFKLNEGWDFFVCAIFEDFPKNSHLQIDMLIQRKALFYYVRNFNNATGMLDDSHIGEIRESDPYSQMDWTHRSYTYIKLKPGCNIASVESKYAQAIKPCIKKMNDAGEGVKFTFQPVSSIHLMSDLRDEIAVNGNSFRVTAFSVIGVLIMIISWFNFMNLSIAVYMKQSAKDYVKRIIGAGKKHLLIQHMLETFMIHGTAGMVSLNIVIFLLKRGFHLAGFHIFSSDYFGLSVTCLVLVVAGTFFSSLYPLYMIARNQPANLPKNPSWLGNQNLFSRQALVIFQFGVAIFLIVCTYCIFKQIWFMQEQKLGLNINQTMVSYSPMSMIKKPALRMKLKAFQDEIGRVPGVVSFTTAESVPGKVFWRTSNEVHLADGQENKYLFSLTNIDQNFFDFFSVKMLAGTDFLPTSDYDSKEIIINHLACQRLGISNSQSAINQMVTINKETYRIAGVVDDYHHLSLKDEVAPVIFFKSLQWYQDVGYYCIKISPVNLKATVSNVKKVWENIYPDEPYLFSFLDDTYNALYEEDKKFGSIYMFFSLLAIFIACMGLFALARISAENKIKEIGIRKVNGAKIIEVIAMLNKDFIKWITIAFLIASPLAWYAMYKWLQNFAYKTNLDWWIFAIAGAGTLAVALLTVSWQSWRAATRNPVEALRYE
jgi:putative ABC transport system permease protein